MSRRFWALAFLAWAPSLPLAAAPAASQYVQAANQSFTRGDYGRAADYYWAALQLDPQDGGAYQGLGGCAYVQGDRATALADDERALSLQPGNAALARFVRALRSQTPAPRPASSPLREAFDLRLESDRGLRVTGGLSGGGAIKSSTPAALGGFSGGLDLGVELNEDLCLLAGVGYLSLPAVHVYDYSRTELWIYPYAKLFAVGPGRPLRPYILAGGGLADQKLVFPGASEGNDLLYPILVFGGGTDLGLFPGADLFFEAKFIITLEEHGFSDLPVVAGLQFD